METCNADAPIWEYVRIFDADGGIVAVLRGKTIEDQSRAREAAERIVLSVNNPDLHADAALSAGGAKC